MTTEHDLDEQTDAIHKEAMVAILANIPDPVRPIAQKCLTDIIGRAYDNGFRAGIQHAIERIEAR